MKPRARECRPASAPMTAYANEGAIEIDLGRHKPVEAEQRYEYYVSGSKRTGGLLCSEKAQTLVVRLSVWEAKALMEVLPGAMLEAAEQQKRRTQ